VLDGRLDIKFMTEYFPEIGHSFHPDAVQFLARTTPRRKCRLSCDCVPLLPRARDEFLIESRFRKLPVAFHRNRTVCRFVPAFQDQRQIIEELPVSRLRSGFPLAR
jgi:hypothetical protein